MVKKKTVRQKHQKDALVGDTSEEELKEPKFEGKICQHINRGLNFARVKRTLKTANIALCGGCSEKTEPVKDDDLPEVWLCLQCGNRGCGRMSTDQHAIQHFKTIHSDCHSLVLSSSSGIVWCYDCDDEVNLQQSRNLRQCVEFLNKSKGNKNTSNDASVVYKPLSNDQHNSFKSVIKEESTATAKATDIKIVNKNKKATLLSKPKGLRNLGNTCFFNAVMQNLNQTHILYKALEKACALDYVWEVPHLTLIDDVVAEEPSDELLKLAIPRQFPLANSLLQVYKRLNGPTSLKNDTVNPSPLFSEISKKCPQFKHFQEQDSHELLRQLLDGLRQDEVKRQKKAILRHFDVAAIPVEEVDDETKKLIKAYGHYASHTLVEKIFGGLFLSTVLCEECKTSSQVFEPFMDMSLPLFEEKHQDNCNQPFLDGGQQKDCEPLRNRKANVEQARDNEYVLSKPKKESGKPSKYQLRKMKELAKKEKKKKNKTRKNSETTEDLLEEEGTKETGSDIDQEQTAEAEKQETDNDHQDSDKKAVNSDEEIKIDSILTTFNEKVDAEIEKPCLNYNGVNRTDILNETDLNNRLSHLNIDDIRTLISSETVSVDENNAKTIENAQEIGDQPIVGNENVESHNAVFCKDSGKVCSYFDKCGVSERFESGIPFLTNSFCQNAESQNILEDLLIDEMPAEKIPEHLSRAMLGKSISALLQNISLKENQGDNIQNHTVADPVTKNVENDSLELLTENLEKHNASNNLESADRMQTLGLQVREVRIRRDSDRQGCSILNSSLSADEEETNLASCESLSDTCDNEDEEKWACNFSESQIKEWILKSLLTLKPRVKCDPNECSIDSSLSYFTKPELLTGSNKFRCEKCTEIKISKSGNKKDVAYSNASKQFLIFSPPAILTLHLKRFQQVGMSLRKVNRFVEFPPTLDLAPYCSSACLVLPHMSSVKDEVLYSLFGVVEHSGRMSSGHYTAYVKAAKRTLYENFMCDLPLNSSSNLEQLLQKFSKLGSEKTTNAVEPCPSNDYLWYYISDEHVREVDEAQVMKCQAYLLFYERIK